MSTSTCSGAFSSPSIWPFLSLSSYGTSNLPAPTVSLFVLRGRYDMTQSPRWYSWNSAALAKQDWIFPERGSCVSLYTFHHFCQLKSRSQLLIYNTGFDASRIPSQTLWSKKGGRRAQKLSHQVTRSEAYDCVFLLFRQQSRWLLSQAAIHPPAAWPV